VTSSRIAGAIGLGAAPLGLLGCILALTTDVPDPVSLSFEPSTPAGLQARAAELRAHLPEAFSVVVAPPYVLVSDAPTDRVEDAAQAVERTVAALRARRLDTSPPHVVDLWLFTDSASYRRGARAHLGQYPPSPSGYYAPKRHAVVINGDAGLGAVVHEAAHPIVQASFPDCPLWLDEGIASWLEHGEEDGARELPFDTARRRLQRNLVKDRLPSLAALTVSTDREFYADPQQTTYAQARHVVLFLHQHGLLSAYVDTLRHEIRHDSTGFATLERFAVASDLAPLQERWARFTMAL
jgi:hypothetical protein